MFKLAEELEIQKEELALLINEHHSQAEKYRKIKNTIKKLEEKHIDHCEGKREKHVSYEYFKEIYEQNRKD